jgi:hypothetical protein
VDIRSRRAANVPTGRAPSFAAESRSSSHKPIGLRTSCVRVEYDAGVALEQHEVFGPDVTGAYAHEEKIEQADQIPVGLIVHGGRRYRAV